MKIGSATFGTPIPGSFSNKQSVNVPSERCHFHRARHAGNLIRSPGIKLHGKAFNPHTAVDQRPRPEMIASGDADRCWLSTHG
jgi:hypothetical protein